MRILFVTDAYPNYVPDLLLHGLRKILGPAVVDYPRKDCLCDGVLGLGICPDDQRCPGWFPRDENRVDRTDIWRKVRQGYFDFVVCDYRAVATLVKNLQQWPQRCAIIDGEDRAQKIQPGPYLVFRRETDGTDYSIPLPMALPEEVLQWITRYDSLPKKYVIGFLGSTHDGERRKLVEALSRFYPQSLFAATTVPSEDDPLPEGRFSRDDYYRRLQQCRVVLSLAGAGYDTFRFWENAACNALHAAVRMPILIPDDFSHKHAIVRFSTPEQLQRRLDNLLADDGRKKEMIIQGRAHLVNRHLTTHRAEYFIERMKAAFS